MNEEPYPFELCQGNFRYEFLSVSDKRQVKKVVLITKTEIENFYNLALLDDLENGSLCDLTETRNDDMRTVMATVIQIAADFLIKNQDSYVIFRGSDPRRHRLYSIIIGRDLIEMSKLYEVYGVSQNIAFPFKSNIMYDYYLIKKKL